MSRRRLVGECRKADFLFDMRTVADLYAPVKGYCLSLYPIKRI